LVEGGTFCGHDFECFLSECDSELVDRYCNHGERFPDGMHYGVIKAVCEKFPGVEKDGSIWHTKIGEIK